MNLIAIHSTSIGTDGQKDQDFVASPCTSVCRMIAARGLCEGCFRTLDEIAGWSAMDNDAKRAVWLQIERRIAQKEASA